MNIVFDARVIQDHFPGIARYAFNLLAALPDNLQESDSILALRLPSAPNAHYQWAKLVERGVRVQDYLAPIFSPTNLLRHPTLTAMDDEKAILHFPYYLRPYRTRQPSVTTIHDLITFVYPQMAPSALTRLSIRLFNALAIRASRAVIAVSRSAAHDLERYFPGMRAKTVVIYEAPDAICTPQPRERIDLIRTKYGLPQMFALVIASNKPHKNLVRLVEAWQKVIRDWRLEIEDERLEIRDQRLETGKRLIAVESPISNLQSPLLVIGGHQDPRYTEAEQRVEELGIRKHVKFIGAVPNEDLPALYSACTLFVFPSLYEGFGLPPLEAMACGAPVTCSNTSSIPEVVGDAALLFDPLNVAEIAAACLRIWQDGALRAKLSALSQKQAAHFSWGHCAQETLQVYRSCISADHQVRTAEE
ncbi:MAG: glycosyltransferase family 4 protein [Chloroflexi bacterium]|nr:glycosyltransferase family 4 protein [Chloroflexota bacterium]MCL5274156.1 glycosyltransferase family 4 protein [Chloroflexota bacterium]